MYGYYYDTPVGILGIAVENGKLCRISFGALEESLGAEERETALHRETKRQLDEYFSGKRKKFELPLEVNGTLFQKKVWGELQKIPYGETRSYKQIAEKVGSPKGCRAVGMANRCNLIPIVIPCHRVIGANGNLVGFMGGEKRIELKQQLLELEQAHL